MTGLDMAAKAATLRELHRPGDPLLLANVWDVASAAKMIEELGYAAVATSSSVQPRRQ